jgi:hypothetical protein
LQAVLSPSSLGGAAETEVPFMFQEFKKFAMRGNVMLLREIRDALKDRK